MEYFNKIICYLWTLETSLMKYMNYIVDYFNIIKFCRMIQMECKIYDLLNVFINYF